MFFATAAAGPDPAAQLRAGVDAFLDACTDPAVQRIMMTDAPSVLGWDEWREIDTQYGLGLVARGVVIVLEGSLAFLGLSVKAPDPTWGSMIAGRWPTLPATSPVSGTAGSASSRSGSRRMAVWGRWTRSVSTRPSTG
jgi:hypothetical protein